jgi:hypothetical protein
MSLPLVWIISLSIKREMELGVADLELGNYLVRFNRQDLAREKQSLRLLWLGELHLDGLFL